METSSLRHDVTLYHYPFLVSWDVPCSIEHDSINVTREMRLVLAIDSALRWPTREPPNWTLLVRIINQSWFCISSPFLLGQ